MKFYQLKYFVETAKHKSFNKAAIALYTNPSNIIVAINHLEEELGYKVFSRSSKGVSLTAEGQHVLDDFSKIVSIDNKWFVKRDQISMSDEVNIYAVTSAYFGIMSEIGLKSMQEYPDISCMILEMKMNEIKNILPILRSGLAIGCVNKGDEHGLYSFIQDIDCDICNLGHAVYKVFMSANHPLAYKEKITLNDIKEFKLCRSYDRMSIALEDSVKDHPNMISMSNSQYIIYTVANHNYISILSSLFENMQYIKSGQVITKEISTQENINLEYYLLSPVRKKINVAEKNLASVIYDIFKKYRR